MVKVYTYPQLHSPPILPLFFGGAYPVVFEGYSWLIVWGGACGAGY